MMLPEILQCATGPENIKEPTSPDEPASISSTDVDPIAFESAKPASNEAKSSVLAMALLKLLNSANDALTHEEGRAAQLITRAVAILNAELEQVERSFAYHRLAAHGHLAPWQVRRAMEFVEANLGGPIRIEELARVARLSAGHFCKAFRVDFNVPPYAYIIRRRIERAQEMMLTTDDSLASIAAACGFADQSHFTRLFQRRIGRSPANWRRSIIPFRCNA